MTPDLQDSNGGAKSELSWVTGMAFESFLLMLALAWGWAFGPQPLEQLHWDSGALAIGALGFLPPFALFLWTLRSNLPALRHHRELMTSMVERVFGHWSVLQLGLISACAGFCEEALFRGAIQASLTQRFGPGIAVLLATMLFGASHLISWTYAILACFIGVYLGLLFIWTGNLLAPMTVHFVYDFVALAWLVRTTRRKGGGT